MEESKELQGLYTVLGGSSVGAGLDRLPELMLEAFCHDGDIELIHCFFRRFLHGFFRHLLSLGSLGLGLTSGSRYDHHHDKKQGYQFFNSRFLF